MKVFDLILKQGNHELSNNGGRAENIRKILISENIWKGKYEYETSTELIKVFDYFKKQGSHELSNHGGRTKIRKSGTIFISEIIKNGIVDMHVNIYSII